MNRPSECRPSVTTRAGCRISSWRCRNGAQAAISSGSGSRLSGGRHFTTFVMKTSSRRQPTWPRRRTSSSPARPTNGRPWRSSLKPGPSPTNITSVSGWPSPGTAFVRPAWSRQLVHDRTCAAISSSAAARAYEASWSNAAVGAVGGPGSSSAAMTGRSPEVKSCPRRGSPAPLPPPGCVSMSPRESLPSAVRPARPSHGPR